MSTRELKWGELPAAFEMRSRLLKRREIIPSLPLPRLSIDEGPLVIGSIGGRFRRGVALVGACVSRAARILKLGPPGAITVTGNVIDLGRESNPDLARQFEPMPIVGRLKGFEEDPPSLYVSRSDPE